MLGLPDGSAHKMFAMNIEFGVETSDDPKLVGYTMKLKVGDGAGLSAGSRLGNVEV